MAGVIVGVPRITATWLVILWRVIMLMLVCMTFMIVVMITRVRGMIIPKRDTFKIFGRTANCLSLPKRDVVRRLAFKDEISGPLR